MKILFSTRVTHWRNKPLLRVGPMSNSTWPTQNELKGIFEDSVSYIMSGFLKYVFSFYFYFILFIYSPYRYWVYIGASDFVFWVLCKPVGLCMYIWVFLCLFFGSFPSICLCNPIPNCFCSILINLFYYYSLDICFLVRNRKRMYLYGKKGGEELFEVEGGDTIINICEKICFQ